VATIVLLAFKEGEREPILTALEAAGHRVVATEPKDPEFRLTLRGLSAVDAVVVDLSHRPAHGRECAGWICMQRRYRNLPLLLTGVPDGEEGTTRAKVPCGRRVSAAHIDKAVAHALRGA
jgi:hypothetical protein